MKQRVTWEILASGQPRPYADSIHRVRVTFEHEGSFDLPPGEWAATKMYSGQYEERVREILRVLPVGFTDNMKPKEWWTTRLNYLKEVSPGVWEFQTTTPFTD